MACSAQHANICARAKYFVFARAHNDHFHFGMFKTHTLHDIIQFDIHTQIVGIQLQQVVIKETSIFIDIHREPSDRSFIIQAPMMVI